MKVIKVDPSRQIRYVSVKHSGGVNIKGLRLTDEDEEYIVNKSWYVKSDTYDDAGVWSVPKEVPIGMEVCGIRTNSSSNGHSLGISFILRAKVTQEMLDENKPKLLKKPECGWLNIELIPIISENCFSSSTSVISLSSSRLSSLQSEVAKFIGRVENLKFHDKNPLDSHEVVLSRIVAAKFPKSTGSEIERHTRRALTNIDYLKELLDLGPTASKDSGNPV